MLTYDLSKRGSTPLYDYLYHCIREDIINGKLQPGERLPSKRTLAQHLNVGTITVANAYAQLVTEGYLASQEKKGYFVLDIGNYQKRKANVEELAEPAEKEYYADFKANRISLQSFPISTWNKLMRETLSIHNEALLKTVPYNGVYELRKAIADYLAANRVMTVQPSQIIIGAGTEYLYSRLMQTFGRACTFAIEDPGYKKFAAISASFGNPWKYIPIDENGLMIDKLEESDADVVHLSPANHFPTGIVMPISRRLELFNWVNRTSKRYIIEDDYDSEFRYNGRFIPPLFAQDTQNKVIYMNTFSKSLVPSLRISYMILPPKLLERYESTMSFYSCTVSSFEQYTLASFISEGYLERHINRMRSYYKEQRALILKAIKNSCLGKNAVITERNAGTHFLLTIKTSLTEKEIRQRARAANMNISMLSDYRYEYRADDEHTLVINYAGIPQDRLGEIIHCLAGIFPECSHQCYQNCINK